MPRSFVSREQYKQDTIGSWVWGMAHRQRKTFSDLAEVLGCTKQAIGYKIHHNSFSYLDMVRIFDYLESPDEEILQVMKL